MKEIVFATNNEHKLTELRSIAGGRLRILSLRDIHCEAELPETSDTLEGNALQKARYVKEHFGHDCFADDTGLLVDALGGAPGVYTARYAGPQCNADDNIDKLLRELEGASTRRARFVTKIAFVTQEAEHLFDGVVEGEIAPERRGADGFGYDPVFAPLEAGGLTFAQMNADAKNAISHRGRAVRAFIQYLRNSNLIEPQPTEQTDQCDN